MRNEAAQGRRAVPANARYRAWGIWGIVVFMAILSLTGRIVGANTLFQLLDGPHWWAELIWWNALVPLGVIAFATVGALIVARQPFNRLGRLALLLASLAAFHDMTRQYAVYSLLLDSGSLPFAGLAGWFANVVSPGMLELVFAFVLLHFPDGRLVRERWRPVYWLSLALVLLNVMNSTINSLTGAAIDPVRPSALTVAPSGGLSDWIHSLVEFGTVVVLLLAVASVFVRWHGVRGIQRQQLKWLGYVGAIIGFSLAGWIAAVIITGDSYTSFVVLSINVGMVTIGVPTAIGVAILRYRLLDIDVVINRTLVYATVMLALAGVYAVSVVSLQAVIGSIAGSSSIAVATSTLTAVALFQPLRTRTQSWVDRRFYRTRYDATVALAEFGKTVRDEVDLERLQVAICRLVTETMQPQAVAFWVPDLDEVSRTKGPTQRAN